MKNDKEEQESLRLIVKSPEELALELAAEMLGEIEHELCYHYKDLKNEDNQ